MLTLGQARPCALTGSCFGSWGKPQPFLFQLQGKRAHHVLPLHAFQSVPRSAVTTALSRASATQWCQKRGIRILPTEEIILQPSSSPSPTPNPTYLPRFDNKEPVASPPFPPSQTSLQIPPNLLFSASDLVSFLQCSYQSTLELARSSESFLVLPKTTRSLRIFVPFSLPLSSPLHP